MQIQKNLSNLRSPLDLGLELKGFGLYAVGHLASIPQHAVVAQDVIPRAPVEAVDPLLLLVLGVRGDPFQ